MVTINQLVDLVADIAGKRIEKRHISGPLGVRGRNSDNALIQKKLDWAPKSRLRSGLEVTYQTSISCFVAFRADGICNMNS